MTKTRKRRHRRKVKDDEDEEEEEVEMQPTPTAAATPLPAQTPLPDVESQEVEKPKQGLAATLLTNIVGIRVGKRARQRRPIPPGYVIRYTKVGQAYLVKEGETDMVADKEAAEEHVRKGSKVPFCASNETLAKTFGEGIYQYFDFIWFLVVINLVLFCLGLVSLIAHFIIDGWQVTNIIRVQENFYLSTYGPEVFLYWLVPTIAGVALFTLGFGPFLSCRIRRRFKTIGYEDDEDRYLLQNEADADVVRDETGQPKYSRRLSPARLALSYLCFLLMLLISNIITLGMVIAQYYLAYDKFWASFLVSLAISIMNFIWKGVCKGLTILEQHYTYSSFLNHHTVKFFVWRVLNVGVMFLGRYLVAIGALINFPIWAWIADLTGGNSSIDGCDLAPLAEQFLVLLLTDLTVGNLIEIFVPWLFYKVQSCCCQKIVGDHLDSGRPDFELAEEYLELLYRQYIVYLGFPFVPVLPFVGIICLLVEYPIDKWRLLRLSKTPPPLRGSMHLFLVFFLFVCAICSLVLFPYGAGWVMAGFSFKGPCPGTVFDSGYSAPVAVITLPPIFGNFSLNG